MENEVWNEIMKLNASKASPAVDIPTNLLKSTLDIHVKLLTNIINDSFEKGCFPDELKIAEVSPIFKKNNSLDKENYRPVSVLSHVSKVFERIMYNQIDECMKTKLSLVLNGFRKNHSTQHCLITMLEVWKNMIDKELILIILGCLMVYVFLRIDEAKRKKRERQERLNRIKFD